MFPRISSLIILFLSFLLFAQTSWSGRVVKVKGKKRNKVLIRLTAEETEEILVGDKLYLTTKSGKKRGLVIVRKMRGDRVIAQLRKGKAKKGYLTRLRRKKNASRNQEEPDESADEIAQEEGSSRKRKEDLRFGLLGAFGTSTQEVKDVADLSGSTTGFKALIDYALFDDLGVRARIGMDILSVSGEGTGLLAGSQFETTITYLTLDLLLRYYILNGESFGLFINGGMGIYSPLSTDLGEPAALQEDSVSTTSLLIFGLGFSFPLGGSMELYLGGDYLYFPPSDDVSTNAIEGKLGFLFAF